MLLPWRACPEWLISRKKVPQKWSDALRGVRSAVTAATRDVPAVHGVRELVNDGGTAGFRYVF